MSLTIGGQAVAKTDMVWDADDAWDGDNVQRGDVPAYFTEGGYHHIRGEGQHFAYDDNGNMTLRQEANAAFRQEFDVQNRLVEVEELFNGGTTIFAYDAGGQRTMTTQPDGRITHYPFPNYEVEGPGSEFEVTRSLYAAAGQPLAVREQGDMDEDYEDDNADGWTVEAGTWDVETDFCIGCINHVYHQSDDAAANTSVSRPVNQVGTTIYDYWWTAKFESESGSAGFYFFASDEDSTHHGDGYMIDQTEEHIRIYKIANNTLTEVRETGAPAEAGQSYTYKVTYDPNTGWIYVYRDNFQDAISSWNDGSPLKSGGYVALRTHNSDVKFDDVQISWSWLSYFHTDHLGSTRAMS
ncbi:MAG: hypothetical protein R3330_18395, partial [Saprospiraceae bacterium]|nr:hypothetical protein [Saprospiraceae bacterium]